MAAFGLGAATPLLLLGQLSREVLHRWRDRMLSFGKTAKAVFGALLLVIGIAILTGVDKQLEAALVQAPRLAHESDDAFLMLPARAPSR